MAQLKSTSITGTLSVTGKATFEAPANIAGTEQTTTKFKTSNGGSVTIGKEGPNSGTMLQFDQVDGTERLKFRASATDGAMVWSQPEANAALYMDLSDSGGVTKRITFNALQLSHPVKISAPTIQATTLTDGTHNYTLPSGAGTLALTSDITANLESPTFTGTPTAPTASAGTNTTQLATTAFVKSSLGIDKEANTGGGTVSQTLTPNIYYIFTGGPTTLTLTLGTGTTKLNEYMFQFTANASGTTLTAISGVTWVGGTPTITASKTYQASIVNGIGVIMEA